MHLYGFLLHVGQVVLVACSPVGYGAIGKNAKVQAYDTRNDLGHCSAPSHYSSHMSSHRSPPVYTSFSFPTETSFDTTPAIYTTFPISSGSTPPGYSHFSTSSVFPTTTIISETLTLPMSYTMPVGAIPTTTCTSIGGCFSTFTPSSLVCSGSSDGGGELSSGAAGGGGLTTFTPTVDLDGFPTSFSDPMHF